MDVAWAALAAGWMPGPGIALQLLAVGLAAGVLGGLLGVGGGLVMIPAMQLMLGDQFGPGSFHLYKLASIAASIVVALPAALRHAQRGAVVPPIVASIVPAALLGVLAGVAAAALFADEQTHVLRRVFGAFMLAVVAYDLYRAAHPGNRLAEHRRSCPTPRRWLLIGAVVGLPSGLIAGLLGVGGGIWAVPAQSMGLGVRVRNAIGNSTGMIVFVSIATAISQSVAVAGMRELRPSMGWLIAALLAPGALVGGWLGAGLTHRVPTGTLRVAVNLLLAAAGLRLLLG